MTPRFSAGMGKGQHRMPSKDELVQRYNRMNTIPQVIGRVTPQGDGDGDMAPTGAGDRASRACPGM